MNKRPNLKPGEISIIAKFKTMNGANFWFKQRGQIENVAEDFLNQAKAAGHNLKSWDKKPLNQIEDHLKKKRKELDSSFDDLFK